MYKLDLFKLDPLACVLLAIVIGLQVYAIFARPCGGLERELVEARLGSCGR